jgi:hypothetical protein
MFLHCPITKFILLILLLLLVSQIRALIIENTFLSVEDMVPSVSAATAVQ